MTARASVARLSAGFETRTVSGKNLGQEELDAEWIVPSSMPGHLLGTLKAQARRSGETDDAMELAQMLVDAYARARLLNETWGSATGFGKRKKLAAVVMLQRARSGWNPASRKAELYRLDQIALRKQQVADALNVAVDGATCDPRVLEHEKVQGVGGVVNLPPALHMTILKVKQELDDTKSKVPWLKPKKKARDKVAPYDPETGQGTDSANLHQGLRKPPAQVLKARGDQVVLQTRMRRILEKQRASSPSKSLMRVAPASWPDLPLERSVPAYSADVVKEPVLERVFVEPA